MIDRRAFLFGAAGAAVLARPLLGAMPRLPWDALAKRLSGTVVRPGDAGFAAYARPNNLRYASRLPLGIARCRTARDVSASILWARENGVPLAARSGGHSYAGYSTTGGLLIDLREMDAVVFDESTGIATLGGGSRNATFEAAFRHRNLAITHGRCPSVGIAGLVLGGGIGFNMRAHGITADRLVATEIVTADGAIHRLADGDDLMWACRGAGGGNFGINTSFSFRTYEVGTRTVFNLIWDVRPEDVFARLVDILDRAPDALGSKVSAIAPTATSGIKVQLLGQFEGTPADLRAMLADVYAIAEPTGSVVREPYWKAQAFLAEPGVPAYYQERSRFFDRRIDHRAVAAIFDGLRRYPKTAREAAFKIFQTGGRVNARKPGDTAFVHRSSSWLSSIELYWQKTTPDAVLEQNLAWLDAYYATIVPLAGGGAYQNFIDPSLVDWKAAYHGSNLERLEAIKRRVDPSGTFAFAEAIPG
ncbi:MAG TPA: FAD-binding oxidoreductase [Candidatus Baltobacteraceae bacterium]|jgi:FAD/FMN-containing dehydrogenase